MTFVVNSVFAKGVDLVLVKDFATVALQEPSYNQNYDDNYYPHNSPSFLCCDNCGGPYESFQCQPMNQNYFEPNPCYDSNYSGFDQPSQEYLENSSTAIKPDLPTEEPNNSLSMGDEQLSTILETKSDEVIRFSVEDLFPIPSESETFNDYTEETSSGSTTTHADNSLPEYDSFLFEIEPDQDSDFIPSDDSFGSDLEVSFPSRTRNKIFVPRIFFEVQSKIFISRETFSISFIRNLLCTVIDTLLLFSSENEDKVFNPGILSSNLLSHRGKITFDFFESPMMISGGDIPFLDDLFLHFYPS
nr:hypothetical protein [Tanacetum cinerariifolium]